MAVRVAGRVLSDQLHAALACPRCGGDLGFELKSATCQKCGDVYASTLIGTPIDFRLRSPIQRSIAYEVGGPFGPPDDFKFGALAANETPMIPNYRDIPIGSLLRSGNRMTPELFSHFPRSASGGLMLDLGCGKREFAGLCGHTGLEYVGVDYAGDEPDLLADAHALPFRNESFDFVLSLAVLEHLRHPAVALAEVLRVLKPGGILIGTVAFLEPFHMDSFAHLTHLGTYSALAHAGFEILAVAPNVEWSGIHAMASMILFPRLPKPLCDIVISPVCLLHRLWWKLGHLVDPKPRTSEAYRLPATTAGFRFVARKSPNTIR